MVFHVVLRPTHKPLTQHERGALLFGLVGYRLPAGINILPVQKKKEMV